MSALSAAIYARLAGDGTLTGLLATLDGAPAIFCGGLVPGAAVPPYIVSEGPFSDEPFDAKNRRGRLLARDITCVTAATASAASLETIAERVRTLFHRVALPITGYATVLCWASGPVPGPSDDTVRARVITVHLTAMAT